MSGRNIVFIGLFVTISTIIVSCYQGQIDPNVSIPEQFKLECNKLSYDFLKVYDYNEDRRIDQSDAEILLKVSVGSLQESNYPGKIFDVNEDGEITSLDARQVSLCDWESEIVVEKPETPHPVDPNDLIIECDENSDCIDDDENTIDRCKKFKSKVHPEYFDQKCINYIYDDIPKCPGFVCGGLCYTQPYVSCVDETAQVLYNKDLNIPYIIEEEHPMSYPLNSNAIITFTIINPTDEIYEVDLDPILISWNPKAKYEAKSLSIFDEGPVLISPTENINKFNILPKESKIISYKIPTNEIILGGNILFGPALRSIDSDYEFGLSYRSKPITVFDPSNNKQCGEYTYTNKESVSQAVCLQNQVYLPLGSNGCMADEDCNEGSTCVEFHCAPGLKGGYDKDPNNVNFILLAIYFNEDKNNIVKLDIFLKEKLKILKNYWDKESKVLGINRIRSNFEYKQCNLNSKEFIEIEDTWDAYDKILQKCDIDDDYTHTYLLFGFDQEANINNNPIFKSYANKFSPKGRLITEARVGPNGRIVGAVRPFSIESDSNFPNSYPSLLFHETMHTFGTPDLYEYSNDMDGASFIWGNCMLMKAHFSDFDLMDYTMCPLEQYYFGVR